MSQEELGFPELLDLNRYPHEPIVKDMAIDLVRAVEGEERLPGRIRKAFDKHKDLIVKNAQWSVTIFAPGRDEHDSDLSQPELFTTLHADQLRSRLLEGAEYAGGAIMSNVTQSMPFRFRYNPIVKIDGERMSTFDWAQDVWAPDYTERFVAAIVLQDAGEVS